MKKNTKNTENPSLSASSQLRDSELNAIIKRMNEKVIDISDHAQETAEKIQNEIAPDKKPPPEQMWMPFCPIPTDMCRVSPFFPVARQKLGDRPYIRDMVITSSSWGEIKYTGPKLSTYEEDILMAILAILDTAKNRQLEETEGKKTYIYKGHISPLLKLASLSDGKANYERFRGACEFLLSSVVKLYIFKRTPKGKKKLVPINMGNIFTWYEWNDESKEVTIVVNPYFYECYIAKSVTLIDIIRRAKLNSPIAKALYRFMQSHRDNVWQGHFFTLASALNLDRNQPDYTLRRLIKRAITELIKYKCLSKKSGFVEGKKDVVKLVRIESLKKIYKNIK